MGIERIPSSAPVTETHQSAPASVALRERGIPVPEKSEVSLDTIRPKVLADYDDAGGQACLDMLATCDATLRQRACSIFSDPSSGDRIDTFINHNNDHLPANHEELKRFLAETAPEAPAMAVQIANTTTIRDERQRIAWARSDQERIVRAERIDRHDLLGTTFEMLHAKYTEHHGNEFGTMWSTAVASLGLSTDTCRTYKTATFDERSAIFKAIFTNRENRRAILQYAQSTWWPMFKAYVALFRQIDSIVDSHSRGTLDTDIATLHTPPAVAGFTERQTRDGPALIRQDTDVVNVITPDPLHPERGIRHIYSKDGRYEVTVPEIYDRGEYMRRIDQVQGTISEIQARLAKLQKAEGDIETIGRSLDPVSQRQIDTLRRQLQLQLTECIRLRDGFRQVLRKMEEDPTTAFEMPILQERARVRVVYYERIGITKLGQRLGDTLMETIMRVHAETFGTMIDVVGSDITPTKEQRIKRALVALFGSETYQPDPETSLATHRMIDPDYLRRHLQDKGIIDAAGSIRLSRLEATIRKSFAVTQSA